LTIIIYNILTEVAILKILKELRIKNNLTCENMATFLNISKVFYWQIENKKRNLSYIMAAKIAKIFNKKPDDIFFDEFKNDIQKTDFSK